MSASGVSNRCRIVLIVPPHASASDIAAAMAGGDVASVILPQFDADERAFQDRAEAIAPLVQQAGAAFIIAGDSKTAGRVGADGIHVEVRPADLTNIVDRNAGRIIVGAGGMKTRHDALETGEAGPDYLFFGKFGFDTLPEPHPRNLALGQWWSEMVEIPAIVMAGNTIASAEEVAMTGADFVALSQAVFGPGVDPRQAVAQINQLLDDKAPHFKE